MAAPWAPHGSLAFTDPTGVVGPTDTVTGQIKFTLDAGSQAIDLSQPWAWDMPTDWLSVTSYGLTVAFGCNDTFSGGCSYSGSPYSFNFDYSAAGHAVLQTPTFAMNPGDSVTFNAFVFTPTVAAVPAGTYYAYFYGVEGYVNGTTLGQLKDADGNPLFDAAGAPVMGEVNTAQYFYIANTCWNSADCLPDQTFSRTVLSAPVPEPETYGMLMAGLGVMGFLRRRRRTEQA